MEMKPLLYRNHDVEKLYDFNFRVIIIISAASFNFCIIISNMTHLSSHSPNYLGEKLVFDMYNFYITATSTGFNKM